MNCSISRNIFFWSLVGIVSVVCLMILWDCYAGDSVIYLCYAKNFASGNGLVFNKGEFSSGMTSPLWALMLGVLHFFPHPEHTAKILGVGFLVAGLALGRKLLVRNSFIDFGLLVILCLSINYSATFFETGLLVFCSFVLIGKNDWMVGVLPFVRPEAIVICIAYIIIRRRWNLFWHFWGIAVWWFTSWSVTGCYSTSGVFRARYIEEIGLSWGSMKRYAILFFPFVLWYCSYISRRVHNEWETWGEYAWPLGQLLCIVAVIYLILPWWLFVAGFIFCVGIFSFYAYILKVKTEKVKMEEYWTNTNVKKPKFDK